ncbi:hypothetical protein KCU71_g88, partial [Aureobasidium melanogenum]
MAPGSKFTSIVVNLPTHHQIHRSTRSKSCWLRRDRLQLPFVFEPARLSKLAQSPTPSLLPEVCLEFLDPANQALSMLAFSIVPLPSSGTPQEDRNGRWRQYCNVQVKKWALAETMAAFAFALELSTISAMADDTLAKVHQRLSRSSKL